MSTEKQGTYMKAERARADGDLAGAAELYREALTADPGDWKVAESLAETLLAAGHKRESLRELFQASHRLVVQKDYDTAMRLLNRMLEVDPEQEFLVTRGVRRRLKEIERKTVGPGESAAETQDETQSKLEELVLDETAEGFRVPAELLDMVENVPYGGRSRVALSLVLPGDVRIDMKSRELFVGSDDSCHLVLPEQGAADRHARILEMDGHYFVYEQEGETFRNGDRIDIAELQDGDRLRFGESGPEAVVEIR